MNQYPYWQKQQPDQPLFPEIEWNKPERRDQAGRLGIVGGSGLGFVSVAESWQTASNAGAGEIRTLLPDVLRKTVPPAMTNATFGASNNAGGLGGDAKSELMALDSWSDCLLFIGDAGKNSQTAILYEELLAKTETHCVVTRDAVDLLQNSYPAIVNNSRITLVLSFAQLQRLFKNLYYPKMLVFSMQLTQLVETLHKFTLSYPLSIVTFHADTLIIARGGDVITQSWTDPMRIWRGTTATKMACYLLWTPESPLKALASSAIL